MVKSMNGLTQEKREASSSKRFAWWKPRNIFRGNKKPHGQNRSQLFGGRRLGFFVKTDRSTIGEYYKKGEKHRGGHPEKKSRQH